MQTAIHKERKKTSNENKWNERNKVRKGTVTYLNRINLSS